MKVWNSKMKGHRMFRRLKEKQLPASTYRTFEDTFVFSQEDVDTIYNRDFMPLRVSYAPIPSEQEKYDEVVAGERYRELLMDDKSKFFLT